MSSDHQIIKLGIVDDHPLYHNGLISLLEKWDDLYDVVLEANDRSSLIKLLQEGQVPEVLIMDISMPRKIALKVKKIIHPFRIRYNKYSRNGNLLLSKWPVQKLLTSRPQTKWLSTPKPIIVIAKRSSKS